jgi:hypothetical protein
MKKLHHVACRLLDSAQEYDYCAVGVAKEDNLCGGPRELCYKDKPLGLRSALVSHSVHRATATAGLCPPPTFPPHDSLCVSLTDLINTGQVAVGRNKHGEFCYTNTLSDVNRACA